MIEIKGQLSSNNYFAGFICSFFLLVFINSASLSFMDLKDTINNDSMTVSETFLEIIVVTIFHLVFILPFLWGSFFFLKKRGIVIGENLIVLKIFKPKEIEYEHIMKIYVEIFKHIYSTNEIHICNICIKPKRRTHCFLINGEHFTDQQKIQIYSLLKQSNKLRDDVWKYRCFERNWMKGGSYRKIEYEDVKDDIETLCKTNESIQRFSQKLDILLEQ